MSRDDTFIEMHESALAQLKDCPFCGSSMRDCCSGAIKGVLTFVTCPECGATMGEPGEEPETPIFERWNTRAPRASEGEAPRNVLDAEDALLAWFDQPVKYDAMGFTRTLRSIMERPEGEARFLEAARVYCERFTVWQHDAGCHADMLIAWNDLVKAAMETP